MGLAETAKLVTQLDLRDNLSTGLDRARGSLNRFSGEANANMARVRQGTGQLAGGLARVGAVAGGALLVGLGGAAKAAIDFEDAFAGVRKTVKEDELLKVGLSYEKLEDRFKDMSSTIPIAAKEFARLGEVAGALGVKSKDIEDFTRVTALLGVTTDLTADAAADGLGRLGTILKFTGKDYEEFSDAMVALGNDGASVESEILEISKRFAGEARAAGLAKEAIAGLASVTASLGFAPERGGTALGRVFSNMATNISLANQKGKTFAEITGKSIRELQNDLNKGRGLEVYLDVLKQISGMNFVDSTKALKELGITNASDRNIVRTMSQNLPEVNRQLKIAAEGTGALSKEAAIRFDTVKSKFQLLKNNLILAGIEIGEGFAPALGRSAEKLSAYIRANKGELQDMGKSIGRAIDGIDWGKIVSGLKTLVRLAEAAFTVISKIPPEVLGIGAAILGVNKISGGLLGEGLKNVVGGLTKGAINAVTSKVPGLGRLVAQPVYVTNWHEAGMMGGGAGGAAGGGSRLMQGLKIAGAVTIAGVSIAALAEQFGVFQQTNAQAQADLQSKVDEVPSHTQAQSLEELRGMNNKLAGLSGLDQMLADTWGGKEIANALEAQSDNIVDGEKLSATQIQDAIGVLKESQKHALARGNAKVAEAIGRNIDKLRGQASRAAAAEREGQARTRNAIINGDRTANAKLTTIANKDTKVSVTTVVNTGITVRDMDTSTRTSSRYGFVAS